MYKRILEMINRLSAIYPNPIEGRRATGLLMMAWGLVLTAVILALLTPTLSNFSQVAPITAGLVALLVMIAYWMYRLVYSGDAIWAARIFTVVLTVGTLWPVYWGLHTSLTILLVVPIVTAGALLNRRGVVLMTLVVVVMALIGWLNQQSGTALPIEAPAATASTDLIVALTISSLVAIFLFVFNGNVRQIVGGSLVDITQVQKIAEFSAETENTSDEEVILSRAIDLVRSLRYTFAQIYLFDETGNLGRRVRTGLGVNLASIRQNLNVGDANAISEAARTRHVVLVSLKDSTARRAHFLPAVNYGIVLPLIYQQQILGVLDVQSDSWRPLTKAQISTLSLLANQIATSLSHTRAGVMLHRTLQEQENIAETLRSQLRELRQAGRQVVSSAWDEYLERRGKAAVGFDMPSRDAGLVAAGDLPPGLRAALELGELHVETVGDEQQVNVPITLRGELLGAMAFAVPANQPVTQRQLDMAVNVANRLALSLETRRLFEQSQAQALRERKASETAALLISATDVSTLVDVAASQFNDALGAIYTHVFLEAGALNESEPPPVPAEPSVVSTQEGTL